MNKDKNLYTIISGRTKICLGGLILYVKEPGPALLNKSYEIYDEVYERAYMEGLYIDEELPEILIKHEIWYPHEEKQIEDLRKQIDDKKVEAFENYFKIRELGKIKYSLRGLNNRLFSLLSRKSTFLHLTCGYAAESARSAWLTLNTTYYNKKKIKDGDFDIQKITQLYHAKALNTEQIRGVAKYDLWRAIWNANKTHGGQLFNKNPIDFTKDQLSLCSYTSMYDNVYEHPESPNPKVIEDDDCLDGWFIVQKRKNEKDKKTKESDDLIRNPKIRNAKEVFLMAENSDEAKSIQDMNDMFVKNTLKQREQMIAEKGHVKETEFNDVKTELFIQANKAVSEKMKGR